MPAKRAQLSIEPIGRPDSTETVRDYDELDPLLRDELAAMEADGESTLTVDPLTAALVTECACDVLKFDEYYRISRV